MGGEEAAVYAWGLQVIDWSKWTQRRGQACRQPGNKTFDSCGGRPQHTSPSLVPTPPSPYHHTHLLGAAERLSMQYV